MCDADNCVVLWSVIYEADNNTNCWLLTVLTTLFLALHHPHNPPLHTYVSAYDIGYASEKILGAFQLTIRLLVGTRTL